MPSAWSEIRSKSDNILSIKEPGTLLWSSVHHSNFEQSTTSSPITKVSRALLSYFRPSWPPLCFFLFYRKPDFQTTKTMNATMSSKKTLAAVLVLMVIGSAVADMADVGLCIRNCAQCKKMLGAYFEGPLCADACVKFKGKMIPDCENIESVAPFLNKLE